MDAQAGGGRERGRAGALIFAIIYCSYLACDFERGYVIMGLW